MRLFVDSQENLDENLRKSIRIKFREGFRKIKEGKK
jgi:DNA helicase TIP49 (TBP-interacting protein)